MKGRPEQAQGYRNFARKRLADNIDAAAALQAQGIEALPWAVGRRKAFPKCSLFNKSIALRLGALEIPRGAASGLFFCKSMSPYHTPTIAGQTFGGIDNPKIVPDVFARNACRLEVPVAPRTLCSRPRGRCRYGWDVRPADVPPAQVNRA